MRHIRRIGGRASAGLLACALVTVPALAVPGPVAAAPAACGPSVADQHTETPWPLTRLRPELAWPMTTGSGVVVAVIDSGVSATAPSLKDQVLPGKDYVLAGGVGDCDEVSHGTFVAGIIAGQRLPGAGFHGVAPGAKILPIRVMQDDQKSFDQNLPNTIADAVDFAVDRGAHVINLSLVTIPTAKLAASISRAVSRNVIVVAAAGNDGASQGGNQPSYPAAYDGVIAVAGVDEQDQHVNTSTSGAYVDVSAPGVQILGPAPQGGGFGLRPGGGTSFAAPYVAGTAALLRAYYPTMTVQQITDRITATADHPPDGRNNQVGFGTVNPYRAVAALTDGPPAGPAAKPAAGLGPTVQDRRDDTVLPAIWTAFAATFTAALVWAGLLVRRARRRMRGGTQPVTSTRRGPPGGRGTQGRREFEPTQGPLDIRSPSGRNTVPGLPPAARRGSTRSSV